MNTKDTLFKDILETLPRNAGTQPEYMKHMNRYTTNPEEYTLTESILKFNAKCSVELKISVSIEDYVADQKETQLEAQKLRLSLFKKLDELEGVSLGSILDHYQVEEHGLKAHKMLIKVNKERTATCPSCGKEQIIELQPLSVDKDYWECSGCGKFFSHIRDGWV